jgi:acrylyl-CoA reductase (NADPH)
LEVARVAERFRAYMVDKRDGQFTRGVREMSVDELPEGSVTVRIAFSAVNYKDGLAAIPDGRVVRRYPMVPGIDLAGTVTASQDPRFREGDAVLATGYGLCVEHFGGFAGFARMPADWVVPLPAGLSLRQSMVVGTGGFTPAIALHRMEENGLRPGQGPVLVTGASGGVGSLAIAVLAAAGYEVVASSGKADAASYLRGLGAREVLGREEVAADADKPLAAQRWAGVIDTVGGRTLAGAVSGLRNGGSAAVIGLTGGSGLQTTVFPFIMRGISLVGVESAYVPMDLRRSLWERLAGPWRPTAAALAAADAGDVDLDGLQAALDAVLQGKLRGRTLVRPE